MKIYIAAPYSTRDMAIVSMQILERRGHIVTSRWLKEADELCDEHARKDLDDVDAADVLLAFNYPGWEEKGTGGRHVEFGRALDKKHIILVGQRSNIFHHLAQVHVVATFEEALAWLTSLAPSAAP